MTRRIPITNVLPTSGAIPGAIGVGVHPDNLTGDWTSVFREKYYRKRDDNTDPLAPPEQPFYSSPLAVPAGYTLIEATVFSVVDNPSYTGRYTVYTPVDAADLDPATWDGVSVTTVRVNEVIELPINPGDVMVGFVTNASTYYIAVPTQPAIIVPPATSVADRPLEFVGRNYSGWGEAIQQNLARLAQNFSSDTEPVAPFIGQAWYHPNTAVFKIWDGLNWNLLNYTMLSPAQSYRHAQTPGAATWTVNFPIGDPIPFPTLNSPYLVHHSFYVYVTAADVPIPDLTTPGGVFKPILPSTVAYSATGFTVTFSTGYAGYVLYRP